MYAYREHYQLYHVVKPGSREHHHHTRVSRCTEVQNSRRLNHKPFWCDWIACHNQKVNLAVFTDMLKSFDKVWKNGLLMKLQHSGIIFVCISGNKYQWIKRLSFARERYRCCRGSIRNNYLQKKRIKFLFNDHLGKRWRTALASVPQLLISQPRTRIATQSLCLKKSTHQETQRLA